MFDALALIARFVLAVVFAVAAVAKLRDREGTQEALGSFGVPTGMLPAATYLLPGAELVAAVLLIIPATYLAGAVWSLVLLVAFTVAIVVNLAMGNRVECRCFGEMSTAPIGAVTVLRNVVLGGLAGLLLTASPTTLGGVEDWYNALTNEGQRLAVASAVLLGLLALAASLLLRLRNQNRGLVATVKALTDPGPQPIPIGEIAPDFTLQTINGTTSSLGDLLERGKPVILTFTDPHCGPCQELVPQLAMWQQSLPSVFTVGIVSRGKVKDNAEHAREHGLSNVLIQEGDEVAEAYGSEGTPSAVLVTSNGRVESDVAVGVGPIRDLFERVIAEHAESLWQQATGAPPPRPYVGLKIGSEPPDLVVTDLEGSPHRLRELVRMPTMLVFWSPRCGFCHQMLDDFRVVEGRVPPGKQIVLATTGTIAENRYMGLNSLMLRDDSFELGAAFMASGTPGAVLIEEGRIASPLESGVDAVLKLSERLVGPLPSRLDTPSVRRAED